MISRRNIRIKVFQTIYELEQQYEQVDHLLYNKVLQEKINETAAMLAAVTHLIYLLSEYVIIHANQKASKLTTEHRDLHVNKKLAGNIIIQQLRKNNSFTEVVKKHKIVHLFDDELIRQLFQTLIDTEVYKRYISHEERSAQEEKEILLCICTNCIFSNEIAYGFLGEKFLGWYNDADMIESWMEKIFNNAASFNFNKLISTDKLEFANELIRAYYEKKDIVFTFIEPKLVNWDADRVAMIDLILLHLGICEMLFFNTIPVKVTINEYIDLAKEYSTLQSGQFVNGLLDNVHKDLVRDNKLNKETYTKK